MAKRKKRRIGAFSRRLSLSDLEPRQVREFDQEWSRSPDRRFLLRRGAATPGHGLYGPTRAADEAAPDDAWRGGSRYTFLMLQNDSEH